MKFSIKEKRIVLSLSLLNMLFTPLILILFFLLIFMKSGVAAVDRLGSYVTPVKEAGAFPLIENGRLPVLLIGKNEFSGVERVLGYFKNDLKMVSGKEASILKELSEPARTIILTGTLGQSELIDALLRTRKIDLSQLAGKCEMFMIQVVESPFSGVDQALVVAGSDKRGTLYGLFELSEQMGVSPWYWWADVPVEQYTDLYFRQGLLTEGEPKIRYRGIFLNDEEPALGRWAVANFGGFTSGFYERLFELLLRLKANFIWPAMWWASFNTDDPYNPVLANELGIVIGTSHHEPMNRAHAEWKPYGGKAWNYEINETQLRAFWSEGIRRSKDFETIITLAMRGDGDEAMSKETNVALLQRIVGDQREIISRVTGKSVLEIPQVWALYKEVQDYYDEGMRVPDDVTLLLCDDNWGNIRKLPGPDEPARKGGYGLYYHFDYVGGPRNYKWLNTSPIQRIWEQMNLAYRHGVDRIWIVNVGDLKPMEFPVQFFLDMAWDPDRFSPDNLFGYTQQWSEKQFGPQYSQDIAYLIDSYTRYNSRRKPELLDPFIYSFSHYREAERVVADYNKLVECSSRIRQNLPKDYQAAFYQLVQYPVEACANLNELYVTVGQNRRYALQNRVSANNLAQKAKELYSKDSLLSLYYNKTLSGGKWDHLMDQTHIGYTYWQQPRSNSMPEIKTVQPLSGAHMGVSIEGSDNWWPDSETEAELPCFDPFQSQSYYLEIFNRGDSPFMAGISCDTNYLALTHRKVLIDQQVRISVAAKWNQTLTKKMRVPVSVSGPNGEVVTVWACLDPLKSIDPGHEGFIETNGSVAIEAGHVSRIVPAGNKDWKVLPGFGRTHSGIMPVPCIFPGVTDWIDAARVEYDIQFADSGEVELSLVLAPTLDLFHQGGLKIAVAFNDTQPIVLNLHKGQTFQNWEESMRTNTLVLKSKHNIQVGKNSLKIWALDPAIVLQRILIDSGGLKPSYLGPPESFRIYHQTERL